MSGLRSLLAITVLAPLACVMGPLGDDLPAGAFTSGQDDGGTMDSDGTTAATIDPSITASTTSSSADTSASSSGEPIEYTHSEHILPVWTESCIDSMCHDSEAPAANLDLMTDGVYDRICTGVHPQSGTPLIDCAEGDPQRSYIFRKLEGTHGDEPLNGLGGLMPPTGPLSDATLRMIESWISNGAMP